MALFCQLNQAVLSYLHISNYALENMLEGQLVLGENRQGSL